MNSTGAFRYSGPLESSKSIVNRALILQAIHPSLEIKYSSHAQDVLDLKKAVENFKNFQNKKPDTDITICFDAGSGGTTFRFFVIYLSKYLGRWSVKLSESLKKRPMEDLIQLLEQLGSTVSPCFLMNKNTDVKINQNIEIKDISKTGPSFFQFQSNFWNTQEVSVDFSKSSQFFSALALAASDSTSTFLIKCLNRDQSSGYENITLELLKKVGVDVKDNIDTVEIRKNSDQPAVELDSKHRQIYEPAHKSIIESIREPKRKPAHIKTIDVGADWSSIIYLLSFCFSGSTIEITNVDLDSKEPDLKGLKFLKDLGLNYKIKKSSLFSVLSCEPSCLKPDILSFNLKKNPDLFPVIVVLLSQLSLQYSKEVFIEYPEQLIFKESDRLNTMVSALKKLGFTIKAKDSKLSLIAGTSDQEITKATDYILDSKLDHRIIMAYELLKSFGYKIKYENKKEVQKSFSNFFAIINGS